MPTWRSAAKRIGDYKLIADWQARRADADAALRALIPDKDQATLAKVRAYAIAREDDVAPEPAE